MTVHRPVRRYWLQAKTKNANEGCNSFASLAGLFKVLLHVLFYLWLLFKIMMTEWRENGEKVWFVIYSQSFQLKTPINLEVEDGINENANPGRVLQCESKNPPWNFLTFVPKRLGIFSPNFTCLLHVPTYAGLQIFIQLSATLTKLCHIKHDHHNVLKMPTIDRNARWVVALNMA